jgi:hypothetical protein
MGVILKDMYVKVLGMYSLMELMDAPMKTMQGASWAASWNSCRTFASDSPAPKDWQQPVAEHSRNVDMCLYVFKSAVLEQS